MRKEPNPADITDALVEAGLSDDTGRLSRKYVDRALVATIADVRLAANTVFPRPEFRRRLETAIVEQLAVNAEATSKRSLKRPPLLRLVRQWRLATAAILMAILALSAWLSPEARAQVARLVCYVPGLGVLACETTGLVMTTPVSVIHGDQTLEITSLLSSNGETQLSLSVTVDPKAYDDAQKVAKLGPQVSLSLRDSNGKQYGEIGRSSHYGADVRELPIPKSTLVLNDLSFAALDPTIRAIDIRVTGPSAVGDWSVHVPLQPPSSKTVTLGLTGGGTTTSQGISISVLAVTTDNQYTIVQVGAKPGPQFTTVLDLHGALQGPPYFPYPAILQDNAGRVYKEQSARQSSLNRPGMHIEDLYFEPLRDDAHSATLDIPYVIVQQHSEPVTLTVPLSGRHLKESFDVNHQLAVAGLTFRVTDAYIAEPSLGQPRGSGLVLDLGLDLGGWQNRRRLQSPGTLQVDHHGLAGVQYLMGGPQWDRVGVPVPANPPADISITFSDPRVAVQGPWRLSVPMK